jgi:hypothetical protein
MAAVIGRTLHSSHGRSVWFRHFYVRLETSLLTPFLIAFFVSAAWGVESMKLSERTRLWGKGGLLLGNVINDEIVYQTYLGGWGPDVLRFANMEDGLGLLHPAMFRTAEISRLPRVGATKTALGYLDKANCSDGPCEITGWAVLPKKRRVADCVVVAYDGPDKGPIIFGVTDQVSDRPDVVQAYHRKELLRCGWTVHFQRSAIPPGEHRISAWALDAKIGTFYELGTPQTLP